MTESTESLPTLRWPARLGLLALSVLLLSLALAPAYQFYLAWIGLVPWFFVIASTRTKKSAFLWSWLGGTLFFFANMWWLWKVTIPGMFALLIYLGLFWGFAAWIFVGCRLIPRFHDRSADFSRVFSVAMIAIVFTALEWLRGNWSMFGNQGLPWLYLGNTQSPFLLMCQVADIGGVYAVTLWVVLVNAAIFSAIVEPRTVNKLAGPFGLMIAVLFGVAVYGAIRQLAYSNSDARRLSVLVIQPNYPQSNSGEKGAPLEEIIRFHVETTRAALLDCDEKGIKVDLIAWSETMMPALNPSMRQIARGTEFGKLVQGAFDQIANLANESGAAMIVGGAFSDDWRVRGDEMVAGDRRNSAYFFERSGLISETRYDKIHLVPFGEFIPYDSIKFIHAILMKLGPSGYEDYVLTPGDENALTVFELATDRGQPHRFVVPICFEDIVGPLCAKMVRGPDGTKRADFLVNITNDGWFTGGQMSQHLQAAVFRSIENRVPTARAVNTGISGFIDSTGRVFNTVPAKTEGWSVAHLKIDPRVTFYTQHGDLFVEVCAVITSIVIVARIVRGKQKTTGTTT
ncbi:MAG: apolipoprotein N-acyltransferase [Anaerolineae bacterium]|nr:apolipoprotein N-acyltransferase [Phycisphaerae bacterium]